MAGMAIAKQRRNTRKKPFYASYRNNDTRLKNKAYKIIKHIERHPKCEASKAALGDIPMYCVKSATKRLKDLREKSKEALKG